MNKIEEAKLNSASVIKVSDNDSDRVTDIYICVGGKVAVVAIGFQGLKCVHTETLKVVNVTNNADRYTPPPLTGFTAESYIGINIGLALNIGTMIHRHAPQYNRNGYYRSSSRESEGNVEGGTINGSFGLWGAQVGYYEKANGDSISILTWQPGLAVELSASGVYLKGESDN